MNPIVLRNHPTKSIHIFANVPVKQELHESALAPSVREVRVQQAVREKADSALAVASQQIAIALLTRLPGDATSVDHGCELINMRELRKRGC